MIRRIIIISGQFSVFILSFLLISAAFADEHCNNPIARLVSVQGDAQYRQAEQTVWLPVELDKSFCAGDVLRVGTSGRAAVILNNESILRIDQNSTINFGDTEKEFSLLNLIHGVLHIFSHRPRSLKVSTPYVNGMVEGTEFLVSTDEKQSFISVFEGLVSASNEFGIIEVGSGQSVTVAKGKAPVHATVVSPRDAVKWTLYYPDIWDTAPGDNGDEGFRQLSMAADYLSVGRVDEARKIIEMYPDDGNALAFLSIIEVVQNNNEQALELAERAVESSPKYAAAGLALSYARQAVFDLEGALEILLITAQDNPDNDQVMARLAELQMSVGLLDDALNSARQAEQLSPDNARAQAVLGFAYLSNVELDLAETAFLKAINLDQAMPLARLGLGLTRIRKGDVDGGRSEIEVAAALDPGSSMIRSYLGKAYFEEKREKLASRQYGVAKELDTADPTPWFYDAILKQTENRPVEALESIQKSIELNDNRAVYRSRLMLDDDLAARSASLGRIYQDLGFEQLALAEGWKSVVSQPGNFSAHRFLSDSYRKLPRHEIARVSELLKSQLLQPLNVNPVQPQLAKSDLVLEGAGPGQAALNEYNSLFLRNRLALQASGLVGSNETLGDELVHSAVWNKLSYSVGQYYYETDGIRDNNDQQNELYNVFMQVMVSPRTSWMFEARYDEREFGDLTMVIDPAVYNYVPTLRNSFNEKSARAGFRHDLQPHSSLIGTAVVLQADDDATGWEDFGSSFDVFAESDSAAGELQHIYTTNNFNLQSGAGYIYSDLSAKFVMTFPEPFESEEDSTVKHANIYSYAQVDLPYNIVTTVGLSGDLLEDSLKDREEISPKLGVTWQLAESTLVRGALFKSVNRHFPAKQTVEPTMISGFSQFFDDTAASVAWLYGVGLDQTFSVNLFGGLQFFHRDLDVPYTNISVEGIPSNVEDEWQEDIGSAYLYWTPLSWISLGLEYFFEDFSHDELYIGQIFGVRGVTNHRFSPQVNFFHRSGLNARIQANYIDQERDYSEYTPEEAVKSDQFWQVDLALSYRLPKRYGILSLGVKNLFDEEFNYIDTDPANPRFLPEQQVMFSLTMQL